MKAKPVPLVLRPKKLVKWPADLAPVFPLNPDGSPAYKITIAAKPADPRFTTTHAE